ncbi:MAG TPA: hypothetical protein VLX31_07770 [Streptosporangiaceae bacterium]|nr:hypothetical protein [Streptosporangiaceae bacterium]
MRTARSRGALSGLFLVLLGAWGGLAPYAGPSFGFGYTPDQAWAQTNGRLYLSAVPGAVVVLTGFVVLFTRSKWFGGLCAFIAALGGAWFVAGAEIVSVLPANLRPSGVGTGVPIGSTATRVVLTQLGVFGGVGVAIVFFAALALGRLSIAAHRDHLRAGEFTEVEDLGIGGSGVTSGLAGGSLGATGPLGYGAAGTAPLRSAADPYAPGGSAYPAQYTPADDAYPSSGDPYQQTQSYPAGPDQQP